MTRLPPKIRTVLIDGDFSARAHLRALLSLHPDIEIVGEEGGFQAANVLLARRDYDLAFLSTGLVGGNGLDLAANTSYRRAIIVVSAREEDARHAFDLNAHDFLLRPVRSSRLAESLRRLGGPVSTAEHSKQSARKTPLGLNDRILLHEADRTHFVLISEISLIHAHENYSMIYLFDGRKMLVRRTLKAWRENLPAGGFIQVHRSKIANLEQVVSYSVTCTRTIDLLFTGVSQSVRVSRTAVAELKLRLNERFA